MNTTSRFQPLVTERLTLRRLRADDAEAMFHYRSDPEVARYQGWDPGTLDDVAAFIDTMAVVRPNTPGTWFQLAICRSETDELIGDIGMHFPEGRDHEAEFGITLALNRQGAGFATEALTAALDYLFGPLGKHRVFGSADPQNEASLRLMERVGMRREAHFRESLWFKGAWADDVICAILDREWRERRS
jgi:RimJ/RimL family protein N-acetyltransferase